MCGQNALDSWQNTPGNDAVSINKQMSCTSFKHAFTNAASRYHSSPAGEFLTFLTERSRQDFQRQLHMCTLCICAKGENRTFHSFLHRHSLHCALHRGCWRKLTDVHSTSMVFVLLMRAHRKMVKETSF